MIGKLRRRFIQIAMTAVLVVMLILVVVINVVFYIQNRHMQEGLLEQIHKMETGPPEFPAEGAGPEGDLRRPEEISGMERKEREIPFSTGYAVIYMDKYKQITKTDTGNTSFMDEDTAKEYAMQAIAAGKEKGWSGSQLYQLSEQGDGYILILMDGSGMKASVRAVLFISAGTALISYLLVFVLVVLFSKRAVRPVLESYEKQKQFITDAGHELKTPLTVISANTEIARMSFGACEWFDGIDKQAERMQYLVRHLISLTKMDEESTHLEKKEFAIGDAVYDTAMSYKGIARNRKRSLTVQVPEDAVCYGNETAIRQVVSILLDNALKYSNEGGGIEVRLRPGKHMMLVIANTCEHIEMVEIDRLFDRFYRGDKSRSSEGGYGLGLSIAKAIVERHGGSIRAFRGGREQIVFEVCL